MAGRGPAPKANRQRRNEPARGDWTDLSPLDEPVLGELPDGEWSDRTRAAWAAWRDDPVGAMWGPSDRHAVVDLAYLHEQWVRRPSSVLAGEIRQRMDGLGLTPKGRQDRRWRIAAADVEDDAPATPTKRDRHLRAV